MGAVVRRAVGFVVVVVAAILFFGCSDGGPSAEAIAEAEALALAALLTEGDLPAGDWEVQGGGMAEMLESMSMVAERSEATPEECGGAGQTFDVTRPFGGVLAMQLRSFVAEDDEAGFGDVAAISLTVMVYESAERVRELVGEPGFGGGSTQSQACLDARAAAMGAEGYEVEVGVPRFGISDEHAFQRTTTITMRGGDPSGWVMEQHTFARGQMIAMYMVVGGGDAPSEVDYQGLLEAFEARVVEVQE